MNDIIEIQIQLTQRQIGMAFLAMAKQANDPPEAGRLFEKANRYFDLAKDQGEDFNAKIYTPCWGLEESDFQAKVEWEGYLDGGKTFGSPDRYREGTEENMLYRRGWYKRHCDILFQAMEH